MKTRQANDSSSATIGEVSSSLTFFKKNEGA